MNFESYQKAYGGKTLGQIQKENSENWLEWNFENDIGYQTAYLFDFYHDNQKTKIKNFHPDKDMIPIEILYHDHTSQTYSKDVITHHIQMRSSQKCNVPYYKEVFGDRYSATFPVGMYILIKDNKGNYNRWIVVAEADYNSSLFSTFEVLPCDYIFRWIYNDQKYEMAGISRSQNSYNSGIWTRMGYTTTNDQSVFLVPMNRDSETLIYNTRMLIDNMVLTEPRCFNISKVNRVSVPGMVHITLAQDKFDPSTDYIEKDEDGSVIAMWANYWKSGVPPTPHEVVKDYDRIEIVHTGKAHSMKIGGNSKIFTAHFYRGDEEVEYKPGEWMFTVNDNEANSLINIIENPNLQDNQIEISLRADDSYIGEDLIVAYKSEVGVIGSITMDIQTL